MAKIKKHWQQFSFQRRGSAETWLLVIVWGSLTITLIFLFSLLARAFDQPSTPGEAAIKAAVLTVGAEQRAIERDGQYLRTAAALGAQEPQLGKYFVADGRLDEYQISADDRALSVEYQSAGGAILLNFLDGNLVAVTCNQEIEDCPSAAELYRRAEQQPGKLRSPDPVDSGPR